jgi:dihydroorotase
MPEYDLLIKGGEVYQSRGPSGWLDVAITDGRIAAMAYNLPASSAKRVISAGGKYVLPGLIDMHTHLGFELHRRVVWPEEVCPASGVTTAVDMGSVGAFTFPWYKERVLPASPVRLFSFINIASIGTIAIHTPYYVEHYAEYVDVADTIHIIEANREDIRGIKVFATSAMVGEGALQAMRGARQVGDATGLPIAVHVSVAPPSLEEVLELLRAGDMITHSYTPHNQGILDEQGKLLPAVRKARARGVLFDLGHGAGSFSFEVARRAIRQGFLPDSISTDVYYANIEGPVKDLPTTVAKFLALGLDPDEVLSRITSKPANALGLPELGALAVGGPADVAVFSIQEGSFPLVDSRKEVVTAHQMPRCEATVCRGQVIYEREGGHA